MQDNFCTCTIAGPMSTRVLCPSCKAHAEQHILTHAVSIWPGEWGPRRSNGKHPAIVTVQSPDGPYVQISIYFAAQLVASHGYTYLED